MPVLYLLWGVGLALTGLRAQPVPPAPAAAGERLVFPGGLGIDLAPGWKILHSVTEPQGSEPGAGARTGILPASRPILLARTMNGNSEIRLSVFVMEAQQDEVSAEHRQRNLLSWVSDMCAVTGRVPGALQSKGLIGPLGFRISAEVTSLGSNQPAEFHKAIELAGSPGSRFVILVQARETDRAAVEGALLQISQFGHPVELSIPAHEPGSATPPSASRPTPSPGAFSRTPAPARPAYPQASPRNSPGPAPRFAHPGYPPGTAVYPPWMAPAPTPEPVPMDDAALALAQSARAGLAIVEGSKGRGSAFLWNDGNQTWAVTNAHVLAGNPGARILTIDGRVLQTGEAFVAVEHDLCRIRVSDPPPGLGHIVNADTETRTRDIVLVIGNAEGAGVVAPLPGRILGLGPRLVEVDSPFVPGNSGSPILHVPTGKALGVATYLTTRSINPEKPDQVEEKVRRFGFRLDSVQKWEPIDWARFHAQAAAVAKIEEASADFIKLFNRAKEERISSADLRNPAIRRAVENLEARLRTAGKAMSQADFVTARRSLLSELRLAARNDIQAFDRRSAYDFFRRKVEEEERFRLDLQEKLTAAIEQRVQ